MVWQASPLNRKWYPRELICSDLLSANLHAKRFLKSQTGGKRPGCAALQKAKDPNDLWCADFKGEFKLGNNQYCYPLTVTDHASRYLLLCEALESTRESLANAAFEQLFIERGLPQAIRSDNGVPLPAPMASTTYQSCPFGGSGSASRSNASNPAIPSRMDATNACIAP